MELKVYKATIEKIPKKSHLSISPDTILGMTEATEVSGMRKLGSLMQIP